jgi:hypothetical protein
LPGFGSFASADAASHGQRVFEEADLLKILERGRCISEAGHSLMCRMTISQNEGQSARDLSRRSMPKLCPTQRNRITPLQNYR